jgi:tetratricopeptide (TPR) repeat protein
LERYRGADALRARALVIYSLSLWYGEDFAKARVIAQRSLELSRAISDQAAEAFSLWGLGAVIETQGDPGQAKPFLEQSFALYQSLGDKFGQAEVSRYIGVGLGHNNFDNHLLLEGLRLYRELGHLSAIADSLCQLAHMAIRGGDFSSPAKWLAEAHTLNRQLGSQFGEAYVSFVYGLLAYWQGDLKRACAYAEQAITLYENCGRYSMSAWSHACMAYTILRQGDALRAKKIFGLCIQQFQKASNMQGLAFAIEGFASLNAIQEGPERAARLFAWVDATRAKFNYPRPPVEQAEVDRDLAMIHSQISDTALEEACESGKSMTTEQAIALALDESYD